MRIKCLTLFDITNTNVNRKKIENTEDYNKKRFQQINFETILQVISIRSQPENISKPIKHSSLFCYYFGEHYSDQSITYWSFEFDVFHAGVFDDGNSKLGNLFLDCSDVPMLIGLEEIDNVDNKINISNEQKNIHFELLYE